MEEDYVKSRIRNSVKERIRGKVISKMWKK